MVADRVKGACSGAWFNMVHRHSLIYNQCWEDPRLDHQALNLGPDDNVVVITSGGCNALDYALKGPQNVFAIDMNPRQNALLELKTVAIKNLEYEDFFQLFGLGHLENWSTIYPQKLRPHLSAPARNFWDRRGGFFSGDGWRWSFYFCGAAGMFARLVNSYIDRVVKVRDSIMQFVDAETVEEQRAIYFEDLKAAFWKPFLRFALRRDVTLSLLGVPRPQRQQLEKDYPGGIAKFIEDRVDDVFTVIPFHDNYFWRVYLTGQYSPNCCPEYLKPDNFQKLKDGLVDCVNIHTSTVTHFLQTSDVKISRYVLLDHMDWLSTENRKPLLKQEWQAIVDSAAPDCRMLWRSAALEVDYIDPLEVAVDGQTRNVGELLTYNRELAADLHKHDRVNTYGSFYIADLCTA